MLQDLKEKTDEEIVFLSLNNSDAFGEIIDRYEKKLQRYIYRISASDDDERSDLIQDVFLSVYENLKSFERGEKFSPWIYRITHNKVLDFWRKNKKRNFEISVEENLEFIESIFNKNEVEDEIERLDNRELTQRLFSKLNLKYRDVFILRYFEEKSYDEISDILRIPRSTVSTLLNRGKKQLEREYQKLVGFNK